MARTYLRVTTPGEQPPVKTPPKTVTQAASDGNRLEELQAMRLRVARAIDDPNTPARDLAALTRRQIEMGKEIEVIIVMAAEEANEHVSAAGPEVWDATAI
jgi:uncharacterized protein with PhoU and TrkA domain